MIAVAAQSCVVTMQTPHGSLRSVLAVIALALFVATLVVLLLEEQYALLATTSISLAVGTWRFSAYIPHVQKSMAIWVAGIAILIIVVEKLHPLTLLRRAWTAVTS